MEEIEIKPEELKKEESWESCCFKLNVHAVLYFTQIIVMLIGIVFSIYQITKLARCEDQTPYFGLLTSLIGIFLPSPKLFKK
jgi:cytochrome b561